MRWKNRIVDEGLEAPDQLLANPLNWRIHPYEQQELMKSALDTIGWIQRITVNRNTGCVVDGHMRVGIAISESEEYVPVSYVDLTEEEEQLSLALYDRLTGLAITDPVQYKSLIEQIQQQENEDLDAFVRGGLDDFDYLSFDAGESNNLKELPRSQSVSTVYTLMIQFDDNASKENFIHNLNKKYRDAGCDYAGDYIVKFINND